MDRGLGEGATDGKYRKPRPNTSPTPGNSAATLGERADLSPYNGFADARRPLMFRPDGVPA